MVFDSLIGERLPGLGSKSPLKTRDDVMILDVFNFAPFPFFLVLYLME